MADEWPTGRVVGRAGSWCVVSNEFQPATAGRCRQLSLRSLNRELITARQYRGAATPQFRQFTQVQCSELECSATIVRTERRNYAC